MLLVAIRLNVKVMEIKTKIYLLMIILTKLNYTQVFDG